MKVNRIAFFALGLAVLLLLMPGRLSAQPVYSTPGGGYWLDPATWIGGVVPANTDDVIIQGPVTVGRPYHKDTVYCHNMTIVPGGRVTSGEYLWGFGKNHCFVMGNLINQGEVENAFGCAIIFHLYGDFSNDSLWQPYRTYLEGNSDQQIYCAPGKSIGSWVVKRGGNSLTALSDLYFSCDYTVSGNTEFKDVDLGGSTLHMGNYSIRVKNGVIYNGRIEGDFSILGTYRVWEDETHPLVFEGNVTVVDTLRSLVYNQGSSVYTLKVEGNLTNQGAVINWSSDDRLAIEITGNIVNQGVWENGYTRFAGSGVQSIQQIPGHNFGGDFTDLDSTSAVVAASDVHFTGNFDLQGSHLVANGHEIAIDGWLVNGYLEGARLRNGYLQNMTTLDSLTILGLVWCDKPNRFVGEVHVVDTLWCNIYSQGLGKYHVQIEGNICNDGLVANNNGGDWLFLDVAGNIENRARWEPHATTLVCYANSYRTIRIVNNDTVGVVIDSVGLAGAGAGSFSITNGGAPATVPPGGSWSVTVYYYPQTVDSTASLQIYSTGVGTLNSVSLLGRPSITGIPGENVRENPLLSDFRLEQNFPNPFNPTTTIVFNLPRSARVSLEVYDLLGRRVTTLITGLLFSGRHTVTWNGLDAHGEPVASGMYCYRLQAGEQVAVRKMLLLR